MTPTNSRLGIGLAALVLAPVVFAGTDPYFNPLTQSSAVASPNHINELNSPWQVPAGMTQVNLFSMSSVEADADQSVQRARNAGNVASMFDMIAYDPLAITYSYRMKHPGVPASRASTSPRESTKCCLSATRKRARTQAAEPTHLNLADRNRPVHAGTTTTQHSIRHAGHRTVP